MITNNDIADAISALVGKTFPGEPVYRDYTPADFQRPSYLVEISGGKFYPNFGGGSVELRPRLTLTTFVKTDPYHQQDDQDLTRRQMALIGLFLPGYIRVKDRAPHVLDEGEMENGLDYAALTVTLSYTLGRDEFMEIQQAPASLMEHLHLRQEVTTHG